MEQIKRNLILMGMGVLLSAGVFLLPQTSFAGIFCSAGGGESTCLAICRSHGYESMEPGMGINGQASGRAGWYCTNGLVTTEGAGPLDNLTENELDLGDQYYYLDIQSIVNVHPVTSEVGAKTALGGVFDTLFSTVQEFYGKIFSAIGNLFGIQRQSDPALPEGENPEVVIDEATGLRACLSSNFAGCQAACGAGSVVTPINGQGAYAGHTGWYCGRVAVSGVDADSALPESTRADLYCDVSTGASAEVQKREILSCVEKSDLSSSEKEAVILKLK